MQCARLQFQNMKDRKHSTRTEAIVSDNRYHIQHLLYDFSHRVSLGKLKLFPLFTGSTAKMIFLFVFFIQSVISHLPILLNHILVFLFTLHGHTQLWLSHFFYSKHQTPTTAFRRFAVCQNFQRCDMIPLRSTTYIQRFITSTFIGHAPTSLHKSTLFSEFNLRRYDRFNDFECRNQYLGSIFFWKNRTSIVPFIFVFRTFLRFHCAYLWKDTPTSDKN